MIPLSQPPEPSAFPSAPNPAPISSRQPATVVDVSKGYSSVNQLSLLPDNVRTATNLEGGTVPTDQESLLLEKYRKERADYEQRQLQKMAELKAKREGGTSQTHAVLEGGVAYEDVDPISSDARRAGVREGLGEINPYQFPVDAVPLRPGKVGAAKRSPKKLGMDTGVLTVGEDYTMVFNTLPKGHVREKIPPAHPQPRTRALSDSNQPSSSLKAAVAYENSPWPSPLKDSPEQESKAEHVASSGSGGEGVGDRQDSNRQSKRKLAKEVVEFDPNKQRKFHMTSDVRKKQDRRSADLSNQVDGGSSADSAKARPFSIHTEEQGLSYAMVNMDDKRRYRLEANATKREGSGTPQHYRVPIASS